MGQVRNAARARSLESSDHDMSSQYWQVYIFKVSDDVRRVGQASVIQGDRLM